MAKYFLDTYALIEIILGNTKYRRFLESELYTSVFNLYELYYNILRDFNEEMARKYFFQFKQILFKFGDEQIFLASKFKLENKRKKLSYADCLGYIIAQSNNMKFLTGDKEFEETEGVEFVRK